MDDDADLRRTISWTAAPKINTAGVGIAAIAIAIAVAALPAWFRLNSLWHAVVLFVGFVLWVLTFLFVSSRFAPPGASVLRNLAFFVVVGAAAAAVASQIVFGPIALRGVLPLIMFPFVLNFCYMVAIRFGLSVAPRIGSEPIYIDDGARSWPPIVAILAVRNEPVDVVRMTLSSLRNLDYPLDQLDIVVFDNSDADNMELDELRAVVDELNDDSDCARIRFHHRDGTDGYKPRNLDLALAMSDVPYVLYVDVDSTLDTGLAKAAVIQLEDDPAIGFVQMPTVATNGAAGYFARRSALFVSLLRISVSRIGDTGGFLFFYGHNGVWRRKALESTMPWEQYHWGRIMIGEDRMVSLLAQAQGWEGRSVPQYAGEWVPMTVPEFKTTFLRWSSAYMQSMFRDGFAMMKSVQMPFTVKFDELQREVFASASALLPLFPIIVLFQNRPRTIEMAYVGLFLVIEVLAVIAILRQFKSSRPFLRRLAPAFGAGFLVQSYATWVAGVAAIRFALRRQQGWKPTGKGDDASDRFDGIIHNFVMCAFGVAVLVLVGLRFTQLPWRDNTADAWFMLVDLVLASTYALCLIAFVLIYTLRCETPVADPGTMTIQYVRSPFE